MGSIRIATIEALPESMRRSRGKRSAARRRTQIHLIAVLVWGKRWTVVAARRPEHKKAPPRAASGRRMISALQQSSYVPKDVVFVQQQLWQMRRQACPYCKSNPDVLVMQSAKLRSCENSTDALN